jgi:large subunit ribosomal protein L18
MANTKSTRKISIKKRIRSIVNGDATSPRLSVFRSNKEIYAQLIDDVSKRTIAAASSRVAEIADSKVTKSDKAAMVGKAIAAKALAAGENTNYNLGLFEIKKGNYNAAMSSFVKSGKTDFNTALAQLLSGDAQMAKASIDNMNPDQLTWECFYLRAICGARLADQDGVTTNLARAVAMNAQARNLAKDDLEFMKFFNNPLFEAAIR